MLNSRAPEAMPLAIHTLRALRQTVGLDEPFTGHLDLPMREGAVQLERRNTVIEGIASWTLDQAFDPESRDGPPVASRGGAVRTSEVAACTMPLFVRLRYHLRTGTSAKGPILCEEIAPLACTGSSETPCWLSTMEGERLRAASRAKGRVAIEPVLPVDLLGTYVLLPLLPAIREPT